MAPNPGHPPQTPTIDARASRRAFNRAAHAYGSAAVLAREIGLRQLERLSLIRAQPQRILDLGCGPGTHTAALSDRYPDALLVALDASREMLLQIEGTQYTPARRGRFGEAFGQALEQVNRWFNAAAQREPRREPRRIAPVQADFERLPFGPGSFDFIWSNFALAHALDLPHALRELAMAVRTGGLVMLTVLGPDTLTELRRALNQLGLPDTTHPFTDMHDVGDMLIAAGFVDPVVDSERLTLEYTTPGRLWGDLRALGAVTAHIGRQRGLTTPRRLRQIEDALRAPRDATASVGFPSSNAPMRLSVEIVYAHAWKGLPKTTEDGRAIVRLHREPPGCLSPKGRDPPPECR
jgi:malonyl-CoA O-methyltransferase